MEKLYNPFSLESKTILITGASSGIGRQCAIDCSRMGAKVALIGRSKERLEETIELMEGKDHLAISYDLTDLNHQNELVREIVARMGVIDGLVNCAGISTVLPLKLMKPEKVDELFKTNVYATIELTRQVLGVKNVNTEGASVIFFSSIMGCVGEVAKSLYSFTKGALISGCRSLAVEYVPKKIRVNVVSPGLIETPINKKQPYLADPEKRKVTESHYPLGLGKTTDASLACVFLLSDASRWITGQNIIVDGGFTMQ